MPETRPIARLHPAKRAIQAPAKAAAGIAVKIAVFLVNPLSLLGYAGERSRSCFAVGIAIAMAPYALALVHAGLGNPWLATFCFAISLSALLSLSAGLVFRDRPDALSRTIATLVFLSSYIPVSLSMAPALGEAARIYGTVLPL